MTRVLVSLTAALLFVAVYTVTHRSAAGPSRVLQPAVAAVQVVEPSPTATGTVPVLLRRSHLHRPQPCTAANWRHRLKPAERFIYSRESSLNPDAREPTTGAYGLGQLLASTYRNLGLPMTSDPCDQRAAARAYMRERYGSWPNALAFWRQNGWW